jgi:glycosyltransferase involved in cell wall biosynthesis
LARARPSAAYRLTTTATNCGLTATTSHTVTDNAAIQRSLNVLTVMPIDAHGRMAAVERQMLSLAGLGVHVDTLKVEGHRRLKYVETLPRLMQRSRQADLIHAHYGYCGWLSRSRLGKPLVVSFMGSDLLGSPSSSGEMTRASRVTATMNKFLARKVAAVIVKSPEMAETLAVPAHVIPNGVDLDEFQPASQEAARSSLGWANDRRYILFPGCPHELRKGFSLAQAVVGHASNAIGEPLELVSLCDVDAKRVPEYMNASDALLMTSFWEGSPNAVKEAMACNLPVVSVTVGDVASLLEGVEASKVCSRDERELADALVDATAGGQRSNGRTWLVRKGLDLESVARRVLEVYLGVAAPQAVPRASLAGGG